MRMIAAFILLFASTAALADNSMGANADLDHTPSAREVIGGLFQFGRFQQGLLESAELNGNEEARNLAALRAEDAAKRDKTLKQIQQEIGADPVVDKPPAAIGRVADPDESEGPAYIRKFYAAQIVEYKSAVKLLEHYLQAPDNAALRAFVHGQLPILRSQLKDIERTMADK